MKILVTGALGHIGSRLVRDLPSAIHGCSILMVDNMLTQRYSSLFKLPEEGNYKFIEADITKVEMPPLLDGVDLVIHLAAITDAAGSFGHAEQVEQNNFNATRQVAEACAVYGVRMLVLSSTSVYSPQADTVDEECTEADLKPLSPYALTKLKEENLVRQLVRDKGLKAIIYRFGTIFGTSPGMRFHTAVNKFCWQAVMKQPITVWSTAYDQKRPYLDLSDATRAIAFGVGNIPFDGQVYNVLTLNSTVRQIVDVIRENIPDLEVKFIDNQIMNQLSYEVACQRFKNKGFTFSGNLHQAVADTLHLLRRANAG